MKRNETDATLKGVGICSLLLSGAIAVFAPALRISPDTPHLRRLEYVGVERRIDWVTPGLLGISAVLAGVGYVASSALVKREAIADEISDAELAKEMMAYKLTDEMQIEEAVRHRGEGNSDKVIEVLVGKPEEPSPMPPPPAIAPSYRPPTVGFGNDCVNVPLADTHPVPLHGDGGGRAEPPNLRLRLLWP